MKSLLRMLLLFSLLSFEPSVFAQAPELSAEKAADRFYRTYLKLTIQGLPTREHMNVLSPLLSADLKELFEAARNAQVKFRQEHPDEKPPWVDGDLFTSLFEGAQSFRVGHPRVSRDTAEIPIALSYREGASTTSWSDILVLVRDGDRWLVWDILMKGEWAFKNGSSLRTILNSE